MYNLIDTHFHLDFYKNHNEIYKFYNDKKIYVLCVTNQPEIFESCISIYGESKYVKFAIGYNPKLCGDTPFSECSFKKNLMKTNYVGEVGLDFKNTDLYNKKIQQKIFDFIAQNASEKNKLMSVHCNKAEEELYNILKINKNKKVIIHWFSGQEEWAERLCNLGCYFSINMNMLKNMKTVDIIKNLPIERILIESDGPFSKVNGRNYKPEYLPDIYYNLGELLGIQSINKLIFDNFKALLLI
ncbi:MULTISPECIES: TatD family hydrolase [unclassified Lacrimispora]|uniref:TatD family hydrolase n=1 Tax=unclassified Lacrimispora TaxID=2719232 RepID=UPI00376F6E7A